MVVHLQLWDVVKKAKDLRHPGHHIQDTTRVVRQRSDFQGSAFLIRNQESVLQQLLNVLTYGKFSWRLTRSVVGRPFGNCNGKSTTDLWQGG